VGLCFGVAEWPFIATGGENYEEAEPLFHPRDAPSSREIQKKIGVELREHLALPKKMPHQLFTLLIQLNDQGEDE
jgi:hypothetical protein